MNRDGKHVDSEKIAKMVGLSRGTVSKVINGYPNISEKTRTKVLNAIKEYRYYPDFSAQILAGKKTNTLGLFFFNSTGEFSEDILVNFMLSSVIESAALIGYHILTYIIRDPEKPETINSIKEVFYQKRIDGGVFIGCNNNERVIEDLILDKFIVGIFDQNLPGANEQHRIVVNFDDRKTARDAINYVVGLGHRDIAIILGDSERNAGAARYEGFMEGVRENNLNLREECLLHGSFNSELGYKVTLDFLERVQQLPTAIVAVNDNVAFGALKALQEKNIQIPAQVSVVGIDGHPLGQHMQPALTTFAFDFHSMMQSLIEEVIRTIDNPGREHVKETFPCEFVERQSCQSLT